LLLSFEGIDASGKNTQSRLLFDYLGSKSGFHAEYLTFPDYGTAIGAEIQAFLTGKKEYGLEARHLLYAANRYEKKATIERWLSDGKVIIANRYCESNLAYGVANGLSLEWLKEIESKMPQSDYIFLLNADPELSQSRKERLRDRYEADLSFLGRVSSVYNALAVPGRWFAIDANQPRETIHFEISKLAMSLIEVGLTSSSRGMK
jgi:dTMP kinase